MQLNAALNVKAGTLQQMQRAEQMVGAPVDKWDDQPKATVVIALLVVYAGKTQAEAEAMSIDDATALINASRGEGADP